MIVDGASVPDREQFTNHQSPITNYQLPITNYQSPKQRINSPTMYLLGENS
ncbi:MAG: hypothetical protein HC942_13005 [Microcoleus sp. SU_5_6]|nr:hypothetical protein [Microcoleus sp. SU_5_6]NJL68559.1 hypothetical protein [Microcoleus sp. SM1_3_4]